MAVTMLAELGDLSRFDKPSQLMAHLGLVPSEHSSGDSIKRGGITKTGNGHARRVLVEAAWSYRMQARVSRLLLKRQQGLPDQVCQIAWKAHYVYVPATEDWWPRAKSSKRWSPPLPVN